MKHIMKFDTTEAFEAAKESLQLLQHYVVYDAQAKKIYLKHIA